MTRQWVFTAGAAMVAAVVLAVSPAAMAGDCPGMDKNMDGKVDIADLVPLMVGFGGGGYLTPEWDLNCDGSIGLADLAAFADVAMGMQSDFPVNPSVGISVRVDVLGAPAPGLTAYEVHLVAATADDRLAVFEGRFDGPMNHGAGAADSYFLLPDLTDTGNWLTIDLVARSDDGPGIGSWLGGEGGTRSVIAMSSYLWQMDQAVARIVIPDGGQVVMTSMVAVADGDYTAVSAIVPEPVSLSLLAVGGLALLRRRR